MNTLLIKNVKRLLNSHLTSNRYSAVNSSMPTLFSRRFAIKTVNVPFMGDSITEGKLLELSKAPGDSVEADEVVAVVETDKTSLEIRSPEAGVIKQYIHPVDTNVKVDTPLFKIDTSAKTTNKSSQNLKMEEINPKKTEEINPEKTEEIFPKKTEEIEEKFRTVQIKPETKEVSQKNQSKKEIKNNATARKTVKVPLSRMRLKIAQRLKESQNTTASLTTFNKIDCHNLIEMRNRYKDQFLKSTGTKLGFMSSFVKASTLSLKKFPHLNAYFDINDKQITLHEYVDISVAVAGPKGLVVPVLRNTESMSFADIEKGIKNYALQAREGKLKLSDMQGGTFTISNSGVYKSLIGTPIINPPQAAVLGIYGIEETPVVINKEITVRPVMQVALTYDHRVVDGREAVLFLRAIKEYIEDPITMLFH